MNASPKVDATSRNDSDRPLLLVTCVDVIPKYPPADRLWTLGGLRRDGSAWKLSRSEVISRIKDGTLLFGVVLPGSTDPTLLSVLVGPDGREVLAVAGARGMLVADLPPCTGLSRTRTESDDHRGS